MAAGEAERVGRALDNLSDRMVDMQAAIAADPDRTAQVVRTAVAEGIRDVLKDPEALDAFWGSAYDRLQDTATKHTGRLVIGGVRAAVVKGSMFMLLGLIVYSVGGWSALVKLWNSVWAH